MPNVITFLHENQVKITFEKLADVANNNRHLDRIDLNRFN